MEEKHERLTAKAFVMDILKEAYFTRLKNEKHGSAKRLIEELDILQSIIKEFQQNVSNEAITSKKSSKTRSSF